MLANTSRGAAARKFAEHQLLIHTSKRLIEESDALLAARHGRLEKEQQPHEDATGRFRSYVSLAASLISLYVFDHIPGFSGWLDIALQFSDFFA